MIIGLIDDLFSLNPFIKLFGQIMVAFIPVLFGIQIHFLSHPLGGFLYLDWFSIPLTIFWLVTLMNIMNLIDGLDGLASGITVVSGSILFIVGLFTQQFLAALLAITLVGSCLSFLRYNAYPAKLFLGDSGSLFLGYLFQLYM